MMNKIATIVVLLLMSCPVYSRELRHGVRSVAALRTAASTSETSGDTEGDDTDNESNDQEMDTETDGADSSDMETDDMDTNPEMDTDDQDTNDTNMNDDDSDGMSSVKRAIRASLKSSALKQSNSSLGRLAAALDSGLSPRQTIKQLLEPADSGLAAMVRSASASDLGHSLSAVTGSAALTTNVESAAIAASGGGKLSAAAAPEPSAGMLAMMGILASLWKRRRPNFARQLSAEHFRVRSLQ